MKAIILAGGQSSRFKPMPDKTTIEFLGKPLIIHRIEALKVAGFTDVDVVASPNNIQKIEVAIKKFNHQTSQVFLQDNPYNNGGAVLSVPDEFLQEPVMFVCANDTVENYLLDEFHHKIQTQNPEGLFLGQEREEYFNGGYLNIDQNGFLREIAEKPGEGNQPSNLINIVYQYYQNPFAFKQTIKSLIDQDPVTKSSYEDAIQLMIDQRFQIQVHAYSGKWSPIKRPIHTIETGIILLSSLEESVVIHPSAQVHPNAKISGNTYIGANVNIDEYSKINDSHILDGSSVVNSRINSSYIHRDVNVIGSNLNQVVSNSGVCILKKTVSEKLFDNDSCPNGEDLIR